MAQLVPRCYSQSNLSRFTYKMHHFGFLVFAIVTIFRPSSGETFENVTLVLNWRSGTHDEKIVTIRRDNELRNYVGQFGEVLIHHQNIPKLAKNSVSNLPKVTHLDLASCKIRKIEPGAFRFLPELTDLNLSGNLLEELQNGIFDQLEFRTLYLENNRIKRIGNWVFRNLKMEYLFIDDNKISEWRSEWFRGTPLTSISMRNNHIRILPRLAFEFLWHLNPQKDVILENLILSGNNLKQIDFDAFTGVKVILSLDLQNNSLTFLEPGIFDSVEVIDRIQLSNNKLAYLYHENFRKTRVLELDLYDNLLECVPTEIFNVSHLEYLNIEKNPINCACYHSWEIWKNKNKKPKIGGWERLENECKGASSGNAIFGLFPLVILVSIVFI